MILEKYLLCIYIAQNKINQTLIMVYIHMEISDQEVCIWWWFIIKRSNGAKEGDTTKIDDKEER